MGVVREYSKPVNIVLRLEELEDGESNRRLYWMISTWGRTDGDNMNLITYKTYSKKVEAHNAYIRARIYWGMHSVDEVEDR